LHPVSQQLRLLLLPPALMMPEQMCMVGMVGIVTLQVNL